MANKKELVIQLAEMDEAIPKRHIKRTLSNLAEAIQSTLAEGGEVAIAGLGKFSTSQRSARTGRNPQTGDTIEIPARRTPKFKASKLLKQAVEKGSPA